MILGFTGTRKGMSSAQAQAFTDLFPRRNPDRFLHGGAIGADEQADLLALKFISGRQIEVYPTKDRYWYWQQFIRLVHAVEDPLIRNRIIANRCDELIATPEQSAEIARSGTWATVRYARQARKMITVIYPDGSFGFDSARNPSNKEIAP